MKPSVRASFVTLSALLAVLLLAPGAAAMTATTQQDGLQVNWHRSPSSGFVRPEEFNALVHFNGLFVLSGSRENGARIWTSPDAHTWSVAWKGQSAPNSIVPGGPGLVAWSDGILLSSNGRKWTQANESLPNKLRNAFFPQIGSAAGVVDAFPEAGHGYWSADGHNWHAISSGPEAPITLAGDGVHLWAMTGGANDGVAVSVWMTADGKNWTRTGQLPKSRHAFGLGAAFGPLGGVIIGGTRAWYSSDTVHWQLASNAPTRIAKGPVYLKAVVADSSGFIETGEYDQPGCVVDPAQSRALTWTSTDGRVWRKMSSTGWLGKEIDQLIVSGRTLIGVGINWNPNPQTGVVWTAHLPNIATDTAPPPPPVNNPGPQGC